MPVNSAGDRLAPRKRSQPEMTCRASDTPGMAQMLDRCLDHLECL